MNPGCKDAGSYLLLNREIYNALRVEKIVGESTNISATSACRLSRKCYIRPMALPSTIHRFKIALSDSDRGIYQDLELRVPMHPSEAAPYFLTRVLAYLLNWEEGIEMMPGIEDPEEPAIRVKDLTGKCRLWIDVGSPAAKRLHKAAKLAESVKVYAYKDPRVYLRETAKEEVYRFGEIGFYSFPPELLKGLEGTLGRDNTWEVTVTGGTLYIRAGDRDVQGEVNRHSV